MILSGNKKLTIALLVWFLCALAILLAPAPREWGDFGHRINSWYDEARHLLQPATHVVLMAIGAFLLIRCFGASSPRRAFILAMVSAITLAVFFELLQSRLPASFARRCDAEDLIPSMIGMVLGGGLGFLQSLRCVAKSE
jgi:VanZ family protein